MSCFDHIIVSVKRGALEDRHNRAAHEQRAKKSRPSPADKNNHAGKGGFSPQHHHESSKAAATLYLETNSYSTNHLAFHFHFRHEKESVEHLGNIISKVDKHPLQTCPLSFHAHQLLQVFLHPRRSVSPPGSRMVWCVPVISIVPWRPMSFSGTLVRF